MSVAALEVAYGYLDSRCLPVNIGQTLPDSSSDGALPVQDAISKNESGPTVSEHLLMMAMLFTTNFAECLKSLPRSRRV